MVVTTLTDAMKFEQIHHQLHGIHMLFHVNRVTEHLFHQSFRMYIHTVGSTIHRIHILQMLCFIQGILILYIISIRLTGLCCNIQFRIQAFQFHTSGSHGKKSTSLVCGACIHMRTVTEHLRVTVKHPVYQLPMLLRSLRSQFSITPFCLLGQRSYHLQHTLSIRSQHSLLVCFKKK